MIALPPSPAALSQAGWDEILPHDALHFAEISHENVAARLEAWSRLEATFEEDLRLRA